MNKISKIKNFEGYYFTCGCCGREIKHAFQVEGHNGATFGSECVYKIAGINIKYAKKQIKELMKLEKRWLKIIQNPFVYGLDSYIESYGSLENTEKHFFRFGSLS